MSSLHQVSGNIQTIIFCLFSFRWHIPVLGREQIQNNGQNSQATPDTDSHVLYCLKATHVLHFPCIKCIVCMYTHKWAV
jgi:hypothetical protein